MGCDFLLLCLTNYLFRSHSSTMASTLRHCCQKTILPSKRLASIPRLQNTPTKAIYQNNIATCKIASSNLSSFKPANLTDMLQNQCTSKCLLSYHKHKSTVSLYRRQHQHFFLTTTSDKYGRNWQQIGSRDTSDVCSIGANLIKKHRVDIVRRMHPDPRKETVMNVFDRQTKRKQKNRAAMAKDVHVYDYLRDEVSCHKLWLSIL